MKRLTIALSALLTLSVVPALTLAHCGSCEHDRKDGQQMAADHSAHDHSGMAAAGGTVDLGVRAEKGVKAAANMKDVRAAMAKMGMKTTHHFMVMFSDEKTGRAIDVGKVAVKITSPGGQVTGPMELTGMQGHFGADVILDKPGEYLFQVGSKLADGEARQYEFRTVVK